MEGFFCTIAIFIDSPE